MFKVLAQCKWGPRTIKPTNQLINSAFERTDRTKEREKTDMRATTCNSFERKSNNPFERERKKEPSSVSQTLSPFPCSPIPFLLGI